MTSIRTSSFLAKRSVAGNRHAGNALTETLVGLLAVAPFLAGAPILGKQLDVKHKTLDAVRYTLWERTVWRSDADSIQKAAADIALEARDRMFGDPRAGMLSVERLKIEGVTENPLWRDHNGVRLLDYREGRAPLSIDQGEETPPTDAALLLVPAIAHGGGPWSEVAATLQVDDLGLNRRAFARASVAVSLRPVLVHRALEPRTLGARTNASDEPAPLRQRAAGAILSDTWSANDEAHFGRRVDRLTTNELIERLEKPGRVIGMLALGRGDPLYGEGQFGWDPELRPRSSALPSRFVTDR